MHARTLLRLLAAVALLTGAQLGLLAGPAAAAERTIFIDGNGPDPVTLTGVKAGDVIVFSNTDPAFPHTVISTSENWSFEATINPRTSFKVPTPLKAAGRYTYADDSPLEDYSGEVVVGSTATAKPTPSKSRTPTPKPSSTSTDEPTPAPSSTGTGSATTPPLIGGGVPTTTPSPTGPPPVTAPEPTGPSGSEAPVDGGTVALPGGTLPEPPTPREYGLPIAVATVGAAGTASLLARFLLAHPAGRRQERPLVTLDGATDPA